jgi:predicted DNA-binding protein (MmcQ/YjbR family)
MVAHDDIRRMALDLPEAAEADHHGFPSFRVAGKIFCTLRDDRPRMMVKLKPEDQDNFVQAYTGVVEPVPGYWGRKGATYVDTSVAEQALIGTLVKLAWAGVAPARLTRS